MFKKIAILFCILCFCIPSVYADEPSQAAASPTDSAGVPSGGSDIISQAAVVLNADTGQILYEKNPEMALPPASITKLMTALLVMERGTDLDETVTISYDAVHSIEYGSTHIALTEGEQLPLRDAMYAMLLNSANDAANVLAEAAGGSLDAFAQQMTERAKSLGCTGTWFQNAHGLDEENHYTTAYDMALIGQALFQYEDFLEMISAKEYAIPPTNKQTEVRTMYSKINMIMPKSQFYSPYVIGAKTGWTTNARHTLVTFAQKDGHRLVIVTLNSPGKYDKFNDTLYLMELAFSNLEENGCNLSKSDLCAAINANLSSRGLCVEESSIADLTLCTASQNEAGNFSCTVNADATKAEIFLSGGSTRPDACIAIQTKPLTVSAAQTAPAMPTEKTESSSGSDILTFLATYKFLFFGGAAAVLVLGGLCIRARRIRAARRRRRMQSYYRPRH